MPSPLPKLPGYCGVAPLVACDLSLPERPICGRKFRSLTTSVVVPETPVNEYHRACGPDDEVRFARQRPNVAPESHFQLAQYCRNLLFGIGFPILHPSHYLAALGFTVDIRHSSDRQVDG